MSRSRSCAAAGRRRAGAAAPRMSRASSGMGVAAEEALAGLGDFAELARAAGCAGGGAEAPRRCDRLRRGRAAAAQHQLLFRARASSPRRAMIALDLAGIAVSAGSACSSGKTKASPVLDAMGVDTRSLDGNAQGQLRLAVESGRLRALPRSVGRDRGASCGSRTPKRGLRHCKTESVARAPKPC